MAVHRKNAAQERSGRKDRAVLIVDDDPCAVSYTSALLVRFNYQILKATSARQALATAAALVPSLALISLDLAGMTGVKLMRQLKNGPVTAHIPLIGLGRQECPDLKGRCFEQGAIAYLCQPVEAETLYRTVQTALERTPRSAMRIRTTLPVKVYGRQCDSLYGAYASALSPGGMFLHTMNPVSVNSEISLEFELDGRAISAETVVIYNCQSGCGPDRETGVGLRFVDMTLRDRDSIREFIRREIMRGIPADGHA